MCILKVVRPAMVLAFAVCHLACAASSQARVSPASTSSAPVVVAPAALDDFQDLTRANRLAAVAATASCPQQPSGFVVPTHERWQAEQMAAAEVLRTSWVHDERARQTKQQVARRFLDLLRSDEGSLETRRASSTWWDGDAPFAGNAFMTFMAQAQAHERRRLLQTAVAQLLPTEAHRAEHLGAAQTTNQLLGVSHATLYALRAGIDLELLQGEAKRLLAKTHDVVPHLENGAADLPAFLSETKGLLDPASTKTGAVVERIVPTGCATSETVALLCAVGSPPNDVQLLGNAVPDPWTDRYAKGCVAAARWHPAGEVIDPIWLRAVGLVFRNSAWTDPGRGFGGDAALQLTQALTLDMRLAAASVLALLDPDTASPATWDRWASVAVAPSQPVSEGARYFMSLSVSGVALDYFVSLLLAEALTRELKKALGLDWARAPSERVATTLVALAAQYRRQGIAPFLEALGR